MEGDGLGCLKAFHMNGLFKTIDMFACRSLVYAVHYRAGVIDVRHSSSGIVGLKRIIQPDNTSGHEKNRQKTARVGFSLLASCRTENGDDLNGFVLFKLVRANFPPWITVYVQGMYASV